MYLFRLASTFSGHKIFFEEPMKSRGSLRYDGVPFVINDSTVLECQFGKDRHKAEKEKKRKISVGLIPLDCCTVRFTLKIWDSYECRSYLITIVSYHSFRPKCVIPLAN